MEAIQYVHIDILNNKNNEYIYTKQNDTNREVVFSFTKNGQVYDIGEDTVSISIRKPDGSIFEDTLTVNNNTAILSLTNEITDLAGTLPYQITFTDSGIGSVFSSVTSYMLCEDIN